MSFQWGKSAPFSSHPEIKAIVAVGHNGDVYKLLIGNGKRIDIGIHSEYNSVMKNCGFDAHKTMLILSEKYGWRYKKV